MPNPMKRYAPVAAVAVVTVLAGCASLTSLFSGTSTTPTTAAVTTLADLAAANSTTAAGLVTKGQLFCQEASGVVAVAANIAGMLVPQYASVIGASASVVAGVCSSIEAAAVPVPAPSNVPLASVPVVTTPAAAALKPTS